MAGYVHSSPVSAWSRADGVLKFLQMCQLAESSIKRVLDESDNAAHLLELHRPPHVEFAAERGLSPSSTARFIRIK